ncbi:hypothetical protein BKA56DRAFT_610251 [Ilyonectria sp. MPI-CAGE-AT-0026]|nr:hypothetical protein BKA56DRAFT_610251 [Ilyonectria sp. MPI-CAGE-AT-0026]
MLLALIKKLAAHVNRFFVASFDKRSPSVCVGTISSLAKDIASEDNESWREEQSAFSLEVKLGVVSTSPFAKTTELVEKLQETVSSLSMGPFREFHVRVNISLGRYVEPALNLRFFVRHGSEMAKFYQLSLSLRRIVDKVQLHDVDARDRNALAALHKHQQISMNELNSSATVFDYFENSLVTSGVEENHRGNPAGVEENHRGNPADFIHHIASTVRKLRFDFDWANTLSIPSMAGIEPDQPKDVRTVADAVKETLELQGSNSLTI